MEVALEDQEILSRPSGYIRTDYEDGSIATL